MLDRTRPLITRLREQAAECKALARRATTRRMEQDLLAMAQDYEHDAARLEAEVWEAHELRPA